MSQDQINSLGGSSEPALDDWTARVARLRAERETALVKRRAALRWAARPASGGELIELLGAERFMSLRPRQVSDLATVKLPALWTSLVLRSPDRFPGERCDALRRIARRRGRPIPASTLRRWLRCYRRLGAAGLIDGRGRKKTRRADRSPRSRRGGLSRVDLLATLRMN